MTEQMNNEKKDRNIPLLPKHISEDGRVTCGNCGDIFIMARRCTLCGQLVLYPEKLTKESGLEDFFKFHNLNSSKDIQEFFFECQIKNFFHNN